MSLFVTSEVLYLHIVGASFTFLSERPVGVRDGPYRWYPAFTSASSPVCHEAAGIETEADHRGQTFSVSLTSSVNSTNTERRV